MRLPSFNDFSPGIIRDVRIPLQIVHDHSGDFDAIVDRWLSEFFKGSDAKRARTNVSATLGNLGLFDRATATLNAEADAIRTASSKEEAAREFVRLIIEKRNGMRVIEALQGLVDRGEQPTKDSLKKELKSLGVTDLSAGTTDHTTLANWMVEAGILEPRPSYRPRDREVKALIGISATEKNELQSLTLAQQVFLMVLRRLVEPAPTAAVAAKRITNECTRDYPGLFDDDQLSAKIIKPLADGGWIELSGRSGSSAGGKSGYITATTKLVGIPIGHVIPDFDAIVPSDLRKK